MIHVPTWLRAAGISKAQGSERPVDRPLTLPIFRNLTTP
jgi:hypothetical protein